VSLSTFLVLMVTAQRCYTWEGCARGSVTEATHAWHSGALLDRFCEDHVKTGRKRQEEVAEEGGGICISLALRKTNEHRDVVDS
jgi:hypothetical protein